MALRPGDGTQDRCRYIQGGEIAPTIGTAPTRNAPTARIGLVGLPSLAPLTASTPVIHVRANWIASRRAGLNTFPNGIRSTRAVAKLTTKPAHSGVNVSKHTSPHDVGSPAKLVLQVAM